MNQLSGQDPEHVPDYRRLFWMDERVFVVLGGGAGIGRQSSHALAQAGATVVVVDRDGAAAAAVAAEVGGIALTADVTRRSSVEGVFADTIRYAGPVRGVVDIVGVASLGPLLMGHEEHRGAMLSRPQPGHRVPALLSAERIEGRPVHDWTAGRRRGQ